jgi:DNA primase
LLAAGLAIRVASIPNGKDPDEFIKQYGGEAFREILNNAEGFFDWFLKRLSTTNDTKTDKGRVTVLREFGEALVKTRNAVLIDTHAQKAALRLGVSVDAVRAEFKKTRPPAESRNARDEDFDRLAGDADSMASAATEEILSAPPTPHEMQLLKLLLFSGDHRPMAAAHLNANWLMNSAVQRIVQRCLKAVEETLPQGAAFLSEFHDDSAAQALIGTILAEHHPIPEPEKQMMDVLTHMRNDFLNAEVQRLTRELTHPDVPDERRLQLLQQQQELRAQRQKPLA